MQPLARLSMPERVAAHLREGIGEGRWSGTLPGVARLAVDLDVSRHTVRRALQLLEAEGLLGRRGLCRSRGITAQVLSGHPLRVGILGHSGLLDMQLKTAQMLALIQQQLVGAGHEVFVTPKSQSDLKHDLRRIVNHLHAHPADAWIVISGSHPLLEWCAGQTLPYLALYGRSGELALARSGPEKAPAYIAATRQLIELGHRRIVLIARHARRHPTPGSVERAFLAELGAHGITTGSYHLPDWEETPAGLASLLENLFHHSPPTALIIDETAYYVAAAEFLARRGIRVPLHVSLVSTDDDTSLAWCLPGIAHIKWDHAPIVRRVVRWIAAVRRGKQDHKTLNFPAVFVPGGSIGPVWKG
ncbi:MAG: substrate-binding domain-containing protein [Verrucomicrobiota bacterium]